MKDRDLLICTLEEKLRIATEAIEAELKRTGGTVPILTKALKDMSEIEDRDSEETELWK